MTIKLQTSFHHDLGQVQPQPMSSGPAPSPVADPLTETLNQRLAEAIETRSRSAKAVAERIAREVERICQKSDRIQRSGEVKKWQLNLAQHRIDNTPDSFFGRY